MVNFSLEHVADGGLRQAALDLVTNGLHEMSLAHAHAAVEEERIVSLGRTLGDRLAGGVGKLIAAADDEGVEGVASIELRGAVPVETRLRWGGCGGGEAAIVTNRSCGGIVFGRDKLYVVKSEAEVVDSFLNKVGIFVAGVAELDGGNANEEDASAGVTVAGGFEPGIVRVPVDFLFQRIENARPGVGGDCCARN